MEVVSGMKMMLGDRISSQASADCAGSAVRFFMGLAPSGP